MSRTTSHHSPTTDTFFTYGPLGTELDRAMERRHTGTARHPNRTERWTPLRLRIASALISVGSRLAGTPRPAMPKTTPRSDPASTR